MRTRAYAGGHADSRITRVVVTQVDDYQPPTHDLTTRGGTQVWIVDWSKTGGPIRELPSVQPSIEAARKLTMKLLKMRPPGMSVDDVLTPGRVQGITSNSRPTPYPSTTEFRTELPSLPPTGVYVGVSSICALR
jgi:hypothetical protein